MKIRREFVWLFGVSTLCVGTMLAVSLATGGQGAGLGYKGSAQLPKTDLKFLTEGSAAGVDQIVNDHEQLQRSLDLVDAGVVEESDGEHQSDNPLDVICTMNRFTAGSVWSSTGFGAGDRAKVWYDPSKGAPIGCGANPYPYRIDSVRTTWQASAADTFIFSVDIECPVIPGDSCSGPGNVIWADTFMVVFSAAGGWAVRVPTPGACVNGPFFVGSELLYWGNTTAWPSFRWGNDGDSTLCTQWLCDPTGCVEWRTIFPQANRGKMQWYVRGNTQDACSPTTCTVPQACDVVCPGGTPAEGEPNCGPQYVDTYNGGCNSATPVFQNINCGQAICGTSGTFIFTDTTQHNYRDTDWYRLVLTTQSQVTWKGIAEFPLQMLIIAPINESCTGYALLVAATGDSCDTVTAVSPCLDPGTYWLWIGPSVFTGIPCGKQYYASVICGPCPSGRCCYGSDPSNPQCADNNEAQCNVLGGSWTVGLTCAGNPCPSHLACQTGPIMKTQPPHNGDESWTGVTSELNLGYLAYDNFANLPLPVVSIRFWGLNAYYSGSWAACNEDPMPFTIRFYPDSANYPASAPTCTYNVSLTRVATTESYLTFPLWEYTTSLSPACNLANGWVSIQGQGDTACWFLWASSPFGDLRSLQWADAWTEHTYDQAMCLAASPCDTSQHADSVTVALMPGNTSTRVRFRAPQAGTYLIYSTVDKNGVFPATYSLEPTGTLNVPAGVNSWIDPAAIVAYKRYVVVHFCP